MNKLFFLAFLFFLSIALSAQTGDYKYHTVEAGETLYGLSRKYDVSIDALLGANPQVSEGLNVGVVLLIPNNVSQGASSLGATLPDSSDANYIYHFVQPKETLYGISKKYDVAIEIIEQENPELLKSGLQIGQIVRIPKRHSQGMENEGGVVDGNYIIRNVQAGETVYSITREANLLANEFFRLNPHTVDGLKEGQEIRLPIKPDGSETGVQTEIDEKEDNAKKSDYKLYQLKADDKLESLLREYHITAADLLDVNPELKEGLVAGRYIIIPLKKSTLVQPAPVSTDVKDFTLTQEIAPKLSTNLGEKGQKNLVLLLPFKAGMEEEVFEEVASDDEVNQTPIKQRVKKRERDAQMSLEFYTGFKMALDTLVGRGYQLQLLVRDTRANQKVIQSEVATIKRAAPDAVVGPLYAKHATALAEELENDGIVVFSPLSRGVSNNNQSNLVAVIPSKENEFEKISKYLNSHEEEVHIIFINTDNPQSRAGVKAIRSQLFAADSGKVTEVWTNRASRLADYLHPTKENVFVVVDQQQAFLTDLVSKLYSIRKSNIRLLTSVDLLAIETIEIRYLNEVKYTSTDLFFIDYSSPEVIHFVKSYRNLYNTEPSRIAFQGYDMGLYVASVFENSESVSYLPAKSGLVTRYNFQRPSSKAGASNDFVFLLEMKDFKMKPISE